jgi:PTS system glucose-specific IIA component
VAAGLSPVVPVVVMDERDPGNITVGTAVGTSSDIEVGATLFTANKQ